MTQAPIGQRVGALRKAAGMTQVQLADLLGLKDRQSISAIESGERKLKADELILVVERFGVSLDDLTNPFLLFNRNGFSWRQRNVAAADLDAFEKRAGEWIGAYRALACADRSRSEKLLPNLRLTYMSRLQDAVAKGESVADLLELGDLPAFDLADAIEERFGILVLMVDAIPGVSGAACHLPELNAILINRWDTAGRRRSDLAHELFHILTWDTMRPARVESSDDTLDTARARGNRRPEPRTRAEARNLRIEQLADNFTFGVLMPDRALDKLPEPQGDIADWLTAAAQQLGVSSRNLKWRMVNSGRLPEAQRITNEELSRLAKLRAAADETPPPFGRRFIAAIANGIEAGEISARRAAKLLDTTIDELGDLCDVHKVQRPAELEV